MTSVVFLMTYPPAEHVLTRESLLTRIAVRVRARKQVALAEVDKIRIIWDSGRDIRGSTSELLLATNSARAEAFNDVLLIIEDERKRAIL